MARIAEEEINRLKEEISLVHLVESQGYQPKKQGKDYVIPCPFHEDDTPSLVITPAKNLYHCFGCGAAGTVIDWTMKTQGVSFRHAVELLKSGHLPETPTNAKPVKRNTTAKHPEPLAANPSNQAALRQVIEFYHETLTQSPEALDYLTSRGLNDPELIERFQLGYANRTLGYRLPEKNRKAGAEIRGQLQEIGILRDSGHEHFSGSLVIPVINPDNQITEVYGRKMLGNRLRKGTPQHLYLPGPHKGVWNESGLEGQEEVILCEALIDAMSFWVNGYKNVTASYGVAGFTDDHLAAFKRYQTKRVLIAYDRDDAGNQAAEALAKKLINEGIECYRLHFPKGMDANQYAMEVKPASKSLGVVIRSAEWMGDAQGSASVAGGRTPGATEEENKPAIAAPTSDINESLPPLVAEKEATKEETTEPLPATAVPPTPVNQADAEVTEHEIKINFGNRHYRVRGLQKNSSYEVLKVNVLMSMDGRYAGVPGGSTPVSCEGSLHVDTFDMYSAKHRQAFAKVASMETGLDIKVVQRDLGQLLLQLESLQDKAIQDALKPKEPTGYTMEEREREQALELLKDENLASRIIEDFKNTGLVGEPTNALMGYLAAVSRKLKTPLAIIVQSTSAAGKSALMDAVLKLVPEEDRVHYSAMTGQSLFYLGETNLKHKILGIAEEEGVRQAAYALKLLQSQGELTIASTGKDPQSGKLITEEYRVEGPVMLFLTTTAIDIDEELLNRCVVLTINESREQTAAIQQRQRQARTLEGLLASNHAEQLIQQHQNAQRLLRPLAVVNPYAEQLAFADSRTRTRRDHEKYLTLIDTIALLHQYQRQIKTVQHDGKTIEYIEVTLDDIALANQLAHDILGRSLDELPPPTRQLLQHLHTLVADKIKAEGLRQNEARFTRREVREIAGLSDKQVRVHLDRLVELEYVFIHHGRNGQRFIYELAFDGDLGKSERQLIGLIDVDQLKNKTTTPNLVASDDNPVPGSWSASGQPGATSSSDENSAKPKQGKALNGKDNKTTAISTVPRKTNEATNSHPLVAGV
ncbi:CHC2 zinc finger domain-containing protein [Shewanella sp.]|uniref:CHC2 zinc finger domain-containing protein n=1 Tax=Shewanella sp. TaxID=50422 RepID=UPI003D09EAC8